MTHIVRIMLMKAKQSTNYVSLCGLISKDSNIYCKISLNCLCV